MIRPLVLLAATCALAVACNLGNQIVEVGSQCSTDSDCENEQLECVPADSANADRVCMPVDDDGQ